MIIQDILEKHGLDRDLLIKQVKIVNRKRFYIVKDGDKYFNITENTKEEIDFVERVKEIPIEKKVEKKKVEKKKVEKKKPTKKKKKATKKKVEKKEVEKKPTKKKKSSTKKKK